MARQWQMVTEVKDVFEKAGFKRSEVSVRAKLRKGELRGVSIDFSHKLYLDARAAKMTPEAIEILCANGIEVKEYRQKGLHPSWYFSTVFGGRGRYEVIDMDEKIREEQEFRRRLDEDAKRFGW